MMGDTVPDFSSAGLGFLAHTTLRRSLKRERYVKAGATLQTLPSSYVPSVAQARPLQIRYVKTRKELRKRDRDG